MIKELVEKLNQQDRIELKQEENHSTLLFIVGLIAFIMLFAFSVSLIALDEPNEDLKECIDKYEEDESTLQEIVAIGLLAMGGIIWIGACILSGILDTRTNKKFLAKLKIEAKK